MIIQNKIWQFRIRKVDLSDTNLDRVSGCPDRGRIFPQPLQSNVGIASRNMPQLSSYKLFMMYVSCI
jgi:hypothetical protein